MTTHILSYIFSCNNCYNTLFQMSIARLCKRLLPGALSRLQTVATIKRIPLLGGALFAGAVFQYKGQEDATELALQSQPIERLSDFGSQLTHEFVLRQSCTLSAEAASTVMTQTVNAIADAASVYLQILSELIGWYSEIPSEAVTEEVQEELVTLNRRRSETKKVLSDLEMLFRFVRKLMDSNAEVCFLVGADFASVQASERIAAAESCVLKYLESARNEEEMLAKAQQAHIASAVHTTQKVEKQNE